MKNPYPKETLDEDYDNGTMPDNVAELKQAIVGRRIVKAEKETLERERYYGPVEGLVLTLNNGTQVSLVDTDDCCAYTQLEEFFAHPEMVDHAITGVGTTDGYTTWHIYADFGDVMELKVGWSAGNPFYYGYGFDITVEPVREVRMNSRQNEDWMGAPEWGSERWRRAVRMLFSGDYDHLTGDQLRRLIDDPHALDDEIAEIRRQRRA